jgi:iron complex outermembrane receptor protein
MKHPLHHSRPMLHSLFTIGALVLGASTLSAQVTGTLAGRVSGTNGAPLVGASVSSATQRGALVRNDGSYQITLPAGRHEVRVRLLGYVPVSESVEITAGSTTSKDWRLEKSVTNLDAIVTTGTRAEERTVMSSASPIDVLSTVDIQLTGRTETAQMIQAVAPSFNFPRTSIGDGTDHIRPATLRGLAPDQALVLVNGKRRHVSGLVNLNGFVGRGSQAVDLNAIPAAMIDRIEILRDGAAAQYGSDAIAGVINIVLKTTAAPSYNVEAGQNMTTYNRDATAANTHAAQRQEYSVRDGKVFASSLNYGFNFGESGFLQVAGDVRDRQGTNRTLPDPRQQYFTGDPRNANAPQINHWQGDSYNHDASAFFNAGTTLRSGVELYGNGGWGERRGASAGFWRRALDDRTVRSIHPDGFLPFIKSDIRDRSLTGGAKGTNKGWNWDLASGFGINSFDFTIDNSNNVSLGSTSTKTSFDAGALSASQWTSTLDFFREFSGARMPLRVALGAEFRRDEYEITTGEADSFRDGGQVVLDENGQPTTRAGAVGSQVFPGFRPSDAGENTRTNAALYVDLESDVTSKFLLGIAGRFEDYSDFGSTTTGKIAARYSVLPSLAFRGTVSTGFRAPSLGQEHFSSTATNFISGVPFDIRTFPVATQEAQLLGARPLEPEKSVNVSAGVALEPVRNLALTVDYYQITIKDRIVLSDNFTGPAIQAIFTGVGSSAAGGRFFTNAIDTESDGFDVVANYGMNLGYGSVMRLTSGYNQNHVRVTRVDQTPPNLTAFQEQLFGRVERTRIEKGNPRNNFFASANYTIDRWNLNARGQRYGEVSVAGLTATNTTGSLDQTYGAKWVTDLSAGITLLRRHTITIGADNVFDVYPERNVNPGDPATGNGGLSNFGIFPYAGISPFGFNGRFVYAKMSVGL